MKLEEKILKQGEWLFKNRSYLPLILLPFIIYTLNAPPWIEITFGAGWQKVFDVLCILISFLGLLVRCFTIGYVPAGTSGRNTRAQVAETLNTSGIYSIVRHPLYLGNFLTFFGVILFTQSIWLIILGSMLFILYYERIMLCEEKFLETKFKGEFLDWAEKTPAFIPDFRGWEKPELPFSLKNVLKREYSGLFGIIIIFTFMKFLRNFFVSGGLNLSAPWRIFLIAGAIIYLSVRILKKRTKIFDVPGR